jgi:hypothetical protein
MAEEAGRAEKIETTAKRYAAHIVDVAESSLTSKLLTDQDRLDLETGHRNFTLFFDELARLIDRFKRVGDTNTAEFGYECLFNIVSGAFLIGSRGTLTESAGRFVVNENSAIARAGNSAKAAASRATLSDVIRAVCAEQNRKMSASEECAQQIRPEVRRALGLAVGGGGYPGIGAIKKAISAMKKSVDL